MKNQVCRVRFFSVLAAALLCTGGCGQRGQTEDTGSTAETSITGKEAGSTDALRVCVVDTEVRFSEEARRIFQEKYPDVKVELEVVSFDNLEEEKKRISSELMAGDGCDLYVNVDYLLEDPYKAQQAGAFTDLVPLFEEYTDLTEEDFMPGAFDTLENGQECYILPLTQSFQIFVIRKEMQETLGISTDSWKRIQDLNSILDAFDEAFPGQDPLSPYEYFYPGMELYGFCIWKGTDNIGILKESDWKDGLDMLRQMRFPDGTYNGQELGGTQADYEKMEREEEKIYQNQVPCLGKEMFGVNDLETYLRMGGEEGADLFPEYDSQGQIRSFALDGIAISAHSGRKADAIRLVQELIMHWASVGNQVTTWKEGNRILLDNLRKQYGSGKVELEGNTYSGLTDVTFEKLETYINQAIPYYPVYVDVSVHMGSYMNEYLEGKVSYEEFMKNAETYLEIYYSE